MSDASEVVSIVTALVGAVGPEIVKAIVAHGAESPAIPPSARAQVRAILYPAGNGRLASEVEHDLDVAATMRGSDVPPTEPIP